MPMGGTSRALCGLLGSLAIYLFASGAFQETADPWQKVLAPLLSLNAPSLVVLLLGVFSLVYALTSGGDSQPTWRELLEAALSFEVLATLVVICLMIVSHLSGVSRDTLGTLFGIAVALAATGLATAIGLLCLRQRRWGFIIPTTLVNLVEIGALCAVVKAGLGG